MVYNGRSRRYRKKRKPRGKIYKKGIPRKALTGAVDSALERRMQELAQKEIKKSIVHLVDRNYYFGTRDPDSNSYTGGRRIYYSGHSEQIAEIDKADIDMPANLPDVEPDAMQHQGSNPAQDVGYAEADGGGGLQGQITKTHHGTRFSDVIKISGFKVSLRIAFDRLPTLEYVAPPQGQNAPPATAWWQRDPTSGAYIRSLPETIVFKWAIVQVFDNQASVNPTLQGRPDIETMLAFKPWGYDSRLDVNMRNNELWSKIRTIGSGSVSYNLNSQRGKDMTVEKYYKAGYKGRPLTVDYLPTDQNGQQLVSSRFFFVCRSNVPQPEGNVLNARYDMFAPRIHLCLATNYHEA